LTPECGKVDGGAPGAARDVGWGPVGTRGGKGTPGVAKEELEETLVGATEVNGLTVEGAVN